MLQAPQLGHTFWLGNFEFFSVFFGPAYEWTTLVIVQELKQKLPKVHLVLKMLPLFWPWMTFCKTKNKTKFN